MPPPVPFADAFDDEIPAGRVIGHRHRGGVDLERVISVDHGAARIAPLTRPGWGRSALAYGPYEAASGLTMAVAVLNGHHASECVDAWPPLHRYLAQWLRGTQVDPPAARLARYRHHPHRDTLRRRVRAWAGAQRARRAGRPLEENLAVGWLGAPAPGSATGGGPAFVVRSTGPTNGVLCASRHRAELVPGLQNVPLLLAVVLREQGALYAAASFEDVPALGGPQLRPLLIDPAPCPKTLWAGVHQGVSGQVGWGVDTRVAGLRIDRPEAWTDWYTTAHAADALADGALPAGGDLAALAGRQADCGGRWWVLPTRAGAGGHRAVALDPGAASGLVHLRLAPPPSGAWSAGVVLRAHGGGAGWFLSIGRDGARLERRLGEQASPVGGATQASGPLPASNAGTVSVQVIDDGATLTVVVEGQPVLGPVPAPAHPGDGTGVGLWSPAEAPPAATVSDFEAHPLRLTLPAALDLRLPPRPAGSTVVAEDRFSSLTGDLADTTPTWRQGSGTASRRRWEHTVGAEPFAVDGRGALVTPGSGGSRPGRVRNLIQPSGQRNAYTVPWPDPHLADLTVTAVAPGSGRGEGAQGRAGVIFWQDPDTALLVNTWIDDSYDGTSISSFLRLGGYEEVFDAVWTNVGRRITWGRPYELRVVFDGTVFWAAVDGEPVLYRAVTDIYPRAGRLRITRVGLVSNWEFGNDTGSRFASFVARQASRSDNP